jgi:hypothetical protein
MKRNYFWLLSICELAMMGVATGGGGFQRGEMVMNEADGAGNSPSERA